MPILAFSRRLYSLLFRKQRHGFPTRSHPQAPFDVLDAFRGEAERLVGEITIIILSFQSYGVPSFGSFGAAVGHRPADLSVEDSFTDPQKFLQSLGLLRPRLPFLLSSHVIPAVPQIPAYAAIDSRRLGGGISFTISSLAHPAHEP